MQTTCSVLRFPVLAVLALLLLTGCDSVGEEGGTIVLRPEVSEDAEGRDISFRFVSDGFPVGQLRDVSCDCEVDLGPFLQDQGFSKADLVSARLESARLVMLFPIDEQFDFLDQAILKFEADGLSATEVANRSGFPAAREATLNVLPNRDVTAFLTRNDFEVILQINARELVPSEEYEMALVMTFRLEVEGL
ncbi:MAG: hypothetical protein KatS3mg043_0581 [Rhodothermaceae bacterium]|nr:MAG: hypothetical protein KatS3mg043_0581 [Rhodothermaceae bacterium]